MRGKCMDPIITNLKRASIELILLSILKEEDMYGYQLAGEIKHRTNDKLSILEGSMYTILNRMKENGDVSFRSEIVGKKMTRIYYHITDTGLKHLDEMLITFNEYVKVIESVINKESQ